MACKKIPLQKSIEFRYGSSINKKQKYFSLPDHQLVGDQIHVFVL